MMRDALSAILCRCVLACAICLAVGFCPPVQASSCASSCMAPESKIPEDIPKMALMGIISRIREKLLTKSISPNQLMDELQNDLATQPQQIRRRIELDKGFPVQAIIGPDGSWRIDVMLWVDEEPVRCIYEKDKFVLGPATMPPLLDRVIARKGHVLEREIPAGPYKRLYRILRENNITNLFVYGGTLRNLLLEREYPHGDLDLFVYAGLTDQEKQSVGYDEKQMRALRSNKYNTFMMQTLPALENSLGNILEKVVGADVEFCGYVDENMVYYGPFARHNEQPWAEAVNISINALCLLGQDLKIIDSQEGFKDIRERRLRFAGTDIKRDMDYSLVFRILQLKYQLAGWGMTIDAPSQELLRTFF